MPGPTPAGRYKGRKVFLETVYDGVGEHIAGKLTREDFEEMVISAAEDARRPVQILERRGAGLDHPVLAGLPETEYLKALYVRAL